MLRKNASGQRWLVWAYNITSHAAKTGDAANITGKLSKDNAALAALGDTNPTELESGYYLFDLTQAETNYDVLALVAVSSTSNIQVRAAPESQSTDELLATLVAGMAVAAGRSAGAIPGSRTERSQA